MNSLHSGLRARGGVGGGGGGQVAWKQQEGGAHTSARRRLPIQQQPSVLDCAGPAQHVPALTQPCTLG